MLYYSVMHFMADLKQHSLNYRSTKFIRQSEAIVAPYQTAHQELQCRECMLYETV